METKAAGQLGAWVRALKQQKGKAGGQSVRNIVSTFKLLLDYAVSPEGGGLLPTNPLRAQWIQDLLPRRARTDARFALHDDTPLSIESVQTLLGEPKVPLWRRVRYALVFTAPMRDGEISGLRISDVHLDAPIPYVDVNKACVLNHRDGFAKLGAPKKPWSIRKLPLHPCAVDAVREWLSSGWEMFVGRPARDDDPFLPRDDGEFARPDSAYFLRQDLKTCELPDKVAGIELHFHDSRGCVATWLKNDGVSDSLLRRFLGHAPLGTAEARYFKGNLLPALADAQSHINLAWTKRDGET